MNKDLKIIDLTHSLSSTVPSWDGNVGFELSIDTDYKDGTPPDIFRAQKIASEVGIGTHMDAPAHAIEGGRTVDQLILSELIVDCIMIDVSTEADENYMIMPYVIEEFEKKHGKIPTHSLVIFYTGWSKYFEKRGKYHNNHKFPSVDVSTARLLIERNIAGLGIDTLSADTSLDGFPVHRVILGADKYLVENIANASLVPPTGAKIFVLPIKIKDATEAPIRLVALV